MGNADLAAARTYHERTRHSFQSVRASRHFLDWDIMPRPFKVYPDLEPIPLPRDFRSSTRPALAAIADAGTVSGTGPPLDRPPLLLFVSIFGRNSWKSQGRAYRHCFWDSGTILANLLALAAAVDLPARIVLGFVDDELNRLLDLDAAREVTLGVVALGRGAPPAPPAPSTAPLGLATLPLSAREVDYPAIREAHAASCLTTPEEAAAWHGTAPRPAVQPAGAPVSLAPLAPDAVRQPVETVIRRRGSLRDFSPEPPRFDQLSTVLWAVTRGIPADFTALGTALTDPYLIV